MSFVSITRLRIRSVLFLPMFYIHTQRSIGQVKTAAGFRRGALLADRERTFWTMTVWNDHAAMKRYIVDGAHRTAMPRLLDWCDEASIVHWDQPTDELPDWAEADARMRTDGRTSKVHHPSPQHAERSYRPPRLRTAIPISPA